MMTAKDLALRDDSFPALTGQIEEDTEAIISELAVGTFVVERGMARLYLVWLTRAFLDIKLPMTTCTSCGYSTECEFEFVQKPCARCGSQTKEESAPLYPTLEAYLSYVSEMTGKSRQTLFNRLRVYRVLCEERGVNPIDVFELNLLSSGAGSALASADEDDPHLSLQNDSWQETVQVALGMQTKSGALEYVKYDVLHKPKISTEINEQARVVKVLREYHTDEQDQYVVEEYSLAINGEWPDAVMDWLVKKLGAHLV